MNPYPLNHCDRTRRQRAGENGGVRTLLLIVVVFLLGLAVGAFWFRNGWKHHPAAIPGQTGTTSLPRLSPATLKVLSRLNGPLEIRFYALLDPASVSESVNAFASRVEQLLSAYQQASGGKINVSTVTTMSTPNANAALADGVQAFDLEKGQGCYLGIALVYGERKEVLPHLSPEWEQALEPDLTRAIARLEEAARAVAARTTPQVTDTNVVQEVKTLIPNPTTTSVEEGTRILREAALKDFTTAAQQFQVQVKAAQQRLIQAQKNGSAAEQQAAMKNLEQVQAEQAEKLKDIAARAQAQVEAFERLKLGPQ